MYAKWIEEDGRFGFSSVYNGGVNITDKEHQRLINGESEGKRIQPDSQGYPVLVDMPPPTLELIAAQARQWRDAEIESLQWLRNRHRDEIDSLRPTTMNTDQSGELLDYVQALRDWPNAAGFPTDDRPLRPSWIALQSA